MTTLRTRALATLAALSLALAAVDAAPSSAAVKTGVRSSIAVHVDGIALPKSMSTERILPEDAARTPAPERRGWKDATPMKLTDDNYSNCKAKTIREWVMIRCEMWPERIDLIAGNRAGVDAWTTGGAENTPAEGVVVFPMRRGDRRVFQLSSRSRYSMIPEVLITELWLPNDPVPSIIAQRI